MDQNGDITIESYEGECIDVLSGVSIGSLTRAIRTISPDILSETRCLQFIDRYFDTVFNSRQARILLVELELLNQIDGADRNLISVVADFIKKYEDKSQIFVKFHGD